MGVDPEKLLSYKLDCHKSQNHELNACPFIWKDFSEKGYATVYAEDFTSIGLYHFHRIGFVNKPVDYYLRPYLVLADKEIGYRKVERTACQGLKLSSEVILSNSLKAMDSISKDVPLF